MFLSVMLVLALLPLSACAPKVNNPADVQAITQSIDDYFKAGNAKNAPAVAAMLTDKTVWLEPYMPAAIGKDAVAKFYQAFFDQFNIEMTWQVVDVRVAGDLGTAHGTYTQKVTRKVEGAAATNDSGNWVVVLQRQGDGSWKWDRAISNSDQPMPGTTADGAEEQAVIKVEQDWGTALAKRDVATIERILGKEWTENVGGKITTRAQAIAGQKSGAIRFESITAHDLSVHVFGDAAVATMIVVIKGTQNGSDRSGSERSTDFFVKRDGRWQAVSTQNTAITQ
jgi:uncharacterized protein (TIGR02246 family)